MLSRIAGSLFWIGRYLERAENISRILEVKLQQFLEDPTLRDANDPVIQDQGSVLMHLDVEKA